jgi:hypothetical protein
MPTANNPVVRPIVAALSTTLEAKITERVRAYLWVEPDIDISDDPATALARQVALDTLEWAYNAQQRGLPPDEHDGSC